VKHFDRKYKLEKYKKEVDDAKWQKKSGDYKPTGESS